MHQFPQLIRILTPLIVGGPAQLIVLPLQLFNWVFRGYRYTLAIYLSWATSLWLAYSIWYFATIPFAPVKRKPLPPAVPTAKVARSRRPQLQQNPPVAARFDANDPNDHTMDRILMIIVFCSVPGSISSLMFSMADKAENGIAAFQGLVGKRFGCPFGLHWRRRRPVDVAASRGQEVLRGSAVASVPTPKKIKPESLVLNLGGVNLHPADECKHFLISGRTGAGKSQAIYHLLLPICHRHQPVMIADPGGAYLSRFGPGFVLNPFDARTVRWSPFAEIENDYDCLRLARAAIPDVDGEARQWHFYAQTLLSELLLVLWQRGDHSTAELLRLAGSASSAELGVLLQGTPAESMTSGNTEKMLGSVRAIISTYLQAWRYLPTPTAPAFSVRQWIRAACQQAAVPWLFAVYRDDQLAVLRNLIACWLDVAIVELLAMPEAADRRVWFIADELDSLGKVGALRDGLTKLRKFGGSVVAGLQTIAQLRSTYGRDEAQVLLSCLATKMILSAGDAETAEYFEKQLGKQEVERTQISGGDSRSMHGMSSSTNWSKQRQIQSAVLASEILTLPDLQGYLQLSSGAIARIGLPYLNLLQQVAPFEMARPAKVLAVRG